MSWIVKKENGKIRFSPVKIISHREMRATSSVLAWNILKQIADKPSYPKEIGRKLNTHEQKIYYHIKQLEKANLIEVVKEVRIHGARTKYYSIKQPAVALVFKPMEESENFL